MQNFFYDNQIRRFLLQFSRMFSNYQCEYSIDDNGNVTLIQIPIRYGDASKQAQTILQENSASSLPCAPLFSFYISSLEYDRKNVQEPYFVQRQDLQQRKYNEVTEAYENSNGNAFTIEKPMPVPYLLGIKLDVWTTNTTMKLQILEQVLSIVNPSLEIQGTDNYLDWSSLSRVELMNVNWSSRSVPQDIAENLDIATLTFELPIWLSPPTRVTKEGVIHKIIASVFDDDGELIQSIQSEDLLNGTRSKITPHGFQVLLVGNQLQVLEANKPSTVNNSSLDPIDPIMGNLEWRPIVDQYGAIRPGISQMRLQGDVGEDGREGAEIIGTLVYHPTDTNILLFTVDTDTLPSNTFAPVDAVINPLKSGPGAGLPAAVTGIRYLITEDIGAVGVASYAPAWYGTGGVVASANDIIEYDGTDWVVSFDASLTNQIEFVTNLTTTIQYKWNQTSWVRSYEGIYQGGQWSFVL